MYITSLDGPDLRSKAIAANSVPFVRALEADGLSPSDIRGVFEAFTARLLADGQVIPARTTGDMFDYGALAYPTNLVVGTVSP